LTGFDPDDGAKSATAATRDYVLKVETDGNQAPLLNVFGGKITTYRRLAESAMDKLSPYFADFAGPWTADAPLPGGDFPVNGGKGLVATLRAAHPYLDRGTADRLIRAYGTEVGDMLAGCDNQTDLGEVFGADLTACEVQWLMDKEWAQTADDVLWRRSKLGLRFSPQQVETLSAWMDAHAAGPGETTAKGAA
jgi:glycerol-3-phosphate dehydrogenase